MCRQSRGKLSRNEIGKVAARPASARQSSLTRRLDRAQISHTKRSPKANLRSVLEAMAKISYRRFGWAPTPGNMIFPGTGGSPGALAGGCVRQEGRSSSVTSLPRSAVPLRLYAQAPAGKNSFPILHPRATLLSQPHEYRKRLDRINLGSLCTARHFAA